MKNKIPENLEVKSILSKEEVINMAELALGSNSKTKRFLLYANKEGVVQLDIESEEESQCIDQRDVRWDLVFDTLSKLPEQQIVLDIQRSSAKVILQY